jgi:hypothetical protein
VEAEGGHAEGASLTGHAICKLELLSRGWSSGHRGVCSAGKSNRAAGCPRSGALDGVAEGSYEQEAAAVEENEEMEREGATGMAKRPDLNELDFSMRSAHALIQCRTQAEAEAPGLGTRVPSKPISPAPPGASEI